MSSFEDKNSSDQNKVTSEFEAWVGILYSCISADNQITDSETAFIIAIVAF